MAASVVKRFNNVLFYIGEIIFDQLNNQDLRNCREVCKDWRTAIDSEKYFWIRAIKAHNSKFMLFNEVLLKSDVKTIRGLALATKLYYFKFSQDLNEFESPKCQLHFAIWLGNKDVFLAIWDKIGVISRQQPICHGLLPLQYAAEYGSIQVFQILYEATEDKDPKSKYGYSLLHFAADNGKFEIVDYILNTVRILTQFVHITASQNFVRK